jgi:hypothetical protein
VKSSVAEAEKSMISQEGMWSVRESRKPPGIRGCIFPVPLPAWGPTRPGETAAERPRMRHPSRRRQSSLRLEQGSHGWNLLLDQIFDTLQGISGEGFFPAARERPKTSRQGGFYAEMPMPLPIASSIRPPFLPVAAIPARFTPRQKLLPRSTKDNSHRPASMAAVISLSKAPLWRHSLGT